MDSIEGFVLAGGQSRRMGQTKANLLLGGKTFIERAAAALSAIANPINTVGNLGSEHTSLSIIQDEPIGENVRGAIIGLYTALFHARTDWVAILACDLPFVSGELLTRIVGHLSHFSDSSENRTCAVLVEQPDGRVQPLCGLYRRHSCLIEVERMLHADNRRLQDLTKRIRAHIIRFSAISDLPGANHFFVNVNTPEDYHAAVAIERNLS